MAFTLAGCWPTGGTALPPEGIRTRTLIADWETPDSALVVYSETWPDTFGSLLDALSAEVPVVVLVEEGSDPGLARQAVEALPLERTASVSLFDDVIVDSVWTRDWGPLQVWDSRGSLVWIDAPYHDDRPRDDAIPGFLASVYGAAVEPLPISVDGGALSSNGTGLCASTFEFFEKWGLSEIDHRDLEDLLGCDSMVLLPALAHEDTKHVDLLLQFVGPNDAVVASFDPRAATEDAQRMDLAVLTLQAAAEDLGIPLRVHRVPLPPATEEGIYYAYLNFLRLGRVALVPQFDAVPAWAEAKAVDALASAMPTVELIPIPADGPLEYGGSVHCLTLGLLQPDPDFVLTSLAQRAGPAAG